MSGKPEKIKIQSILEKGSGRVNEDCLVIRDNIFGVFDGATSLDQKTFGRGETGGQMASTTAGSVFRQNHFPLARLARQANRAIMDRMIRHGVNVARKENLWSTSAAVVRIKEQRLEWIQTGDAMILLVYEDGSHKVLVDREDHDHGTLTLWQTLVREHVTLDLKNGANLDPETRAKGKGDDKIPLTVQETLSARIRKVRRGMNINYGVLNGEKAAENFLNRGTEDLADVRHVLLFTDGLSIPSKQVDKKRDYAPLVEHFLLLGLEGLKDRIRESEKEDPLCLTFPRFKCHDDIAAIALSMA